jgi:hypothetical protein
VLIEYPSGSTAPERTVGFESYSVQHWTASQSTVNRAGPCAIEQRASQARVADDPFSKGFQRTGAPGRRYFTIRVRIKRQPLTVCERYSDPSCPRAIRAPVQLRRQARNVDPQVAGRQPPREIPLQLRLASHSARADPSAAIAETCVASARRRHGRVSLATRVEQWQKIATSTAKREIVGPRDPQAHPFHQGRPTGPSAGPNGWGRSENKLGGTLELPDQFDIISHVQNKPLT